MYIGLYKTPSKALSCLVLSATVLSPQKTPLLDEVLGKRLSWHPLDNPSLLLRETVSCRAFQGGDCVVWAPHPLLLRLQTLGHPVAPYSPVSSRPLLRIAPKKCFHGNAECQSRLQVRSILYPGLCSIQVYLRKEHVSFIRCSTFTSTSRFLLIWFTISL